MYLYIVVLYTVIITSTWNIVLVYLLFWQSINYQSNIPNSLHILMHFGASLLERELGWPYVQLSLQWLLQPAILPLIRALNCTPTSKTSTYIPPPIPQSLNGFHASIVIRKTLTSPPHTSYIPTYTTYVHKYTHTHHVHKYTIVHIHIPPPPHTHTYTSTHHTYVHKLCVHIWCVCGWWQIHTLFNLIPHMLHVHITIRRPPQVSVS